MLQEEHVTDFELHRCNQSLSKEEKIYKETSFFRLKSSKIAFFIDSIEQTKPTFAVYLSGGKRLPKLEVKSLDKIFLWLHIAIQEGVQA